MCSVQKLKCGSSHKELKRCTCVKAGDAVKAT
jgi:hypothetical protein